MHRSFATVAMTALLVAAAPAAAHVVTVDGDPVDWTMDRPTNVNTGHLGRNARLEGEYIWTDAQGDERTDFGSPDTRVDLREFRITADRVNLYVMARMRDIDLPFGDGAPQIQVAIDRDYTPGSGERWFGANSETQTAAIAAWERLIVTRFGSGSMAPIVYDPAWTGTPAGVQSISSVNDVIELAIPWTALGGVPTAPVQFTVIVLRSNASDDAWDPPSSVEPSSDVLDAVTNYANPGLTSNTWAEVSDNTVDYHFQIWFHLDPDVEPSPPLVVNEVLPNAVTEPGAEWYEIYNRTGIDLPLAAGALSFLLTDEETVDGGEGGGVFPPGAVIVADDVVLIAHNSASYAGEFPTHPAPDFELAAGSMTIPNLLGGSLWCGAVGGCSATNIVLGNGNDELLLLDPFFTVIDVAGWGTTSSPYPGTTYRPAPGESRSIERPQPREDTNDCTVDFYEHAASEITPGAVWGRNGTPCSSDAQCGSGFCADGVCCNSACGDSAPDDCQACSLAAGGTADGTCTALSPSVAPTVTCRAAAGDCDVAETCVSTSMSCPTDVLRPNTYECRASTGICDPAEFCTGSAADCPTNAFRPPSYECRAATGDCDLAEFCTGSSGACPADAVRPDDYVCRAATLACDLPETCDGSSKDCPTDAFRPASYVCRAAAGDCDLPENCSGTGPACPADVLRPDTYECRASTGICDPAEFCTGSAADCPTNAFRPSTYECRAATGSGCDVAEFCTGSSGACPADAVRPDDYVCRAATLACDIAETCDGSTKNCPTDAFRPASYVCRAAAGDCDLPENCTGSSADCPTDTFRPPSYVCRTAAGDCDLPENCTGSDADCPADAFRPNSYVCRAAAGDCDLAENCSGSDADCPADAFRPSSYVCRSAAGDCDVAENCSGSDAGCPTDAFHPASHVCRSAADVCDLPENCTGSDAGCPTDAFVAAGTECREASCTSGQATAAADCTGSSAYCPAAVITICDPYVCGIDACLSSCVTDADCTAANWCDAGTCVPRGDLGTPCTTDAACSSGYCVDGVCCNTACDRQCEACDVSGSRGTCSPVTGAPHGDRTACASDGSVCGGACDGTDPTGCAYPGDTVQCRAPSCADDVAVLEAFCQGDGTCPAEQTQDCAPYACAGDLCGGDCTTDDDCDDTNYCSGGLCVPRLEVGEACAGDRQCAGGFCVDGYCCDEACDGQCEACDVADLEGTCSPVAGAPHGGRDACAGTGACAATCNGTDRETCAYPGEETVCSDPSCDAGAAVAAGVCNGVGDCAVPDPVDCAPYTCGEDACLDACDGDEDCADGYVCDGDACVPESADADADGDADAETDAEADAETDADADAEADAELDGVGDGSADGDVTGTGGGEGCGCRTAGGSAAGGLLLGLLAVLGLGLARRRRS